jgi:FAD/FMN-containing dehydrogenase
MEAVTADGDLVRASEDENADLLWAARGAGPGFFAAVTAFHLRLYPKPPVVANGVFLYPLDCLEEVFRWAHEIGPRVPRAMELMVVIHRDAEGEPEIAVTGPVLMDSEEEAADALALLETCPALPRAKVAVPNLPTPLEDLYAGVHASYPDGHRYSADNMWTHAAAEDLLPGLERIAATLPEAPSHMLWMNWGASPARPDMAYSVEDETYIALYGVWTDPARDDANVDWVTDRMREMEGLSTGIQLADENLGRRPARFATDANMERLDEVRARHDPDGRFHEWMGRL